MKKATESYLKIMYQEQYKDPRYALYVRQSKVDFTAGFNSSKKLKWNDVNDKLPKSDHWCLCWVENKNNIHWSEFKVGSYQKNNWYLNSGRQIYDIITHWIKIEKPI